MFLRVGITKSQQIEKLYNPGLLKDAKHCTWVCAVEARPTN